MSAVNELHSEAMDLAEFGLLERMRGNAEKALAFFEQALEYELAAIDALEEPVEPTYSVLHRSAATLAMDCNQLRKAERIAAKALAQDPHPEIAEELRDLMEQINFQRHLSLRGVALGEDEVQMSLSGQAVGFGFVQSNEVMGRINNASTLMYRIAEFRSKKPYRKRGGPPKSLKEKYQIFLSAPRAASFAVTLKFGNLVQQLSLQALSDTDAVISDFLDLMEVANKSSDISELERRIPNTEYLWNILGLAKSLAPDGQRIRQVGFTVLRHGETRTVAVHRPQSRFPVPRPKSTKARPVEVEGILLRADATQRHKNIIGIMDESGASHIVSVPVGLMNDIVKPLWDSRVSVKGVRMPKDPSNFIRLQEISPLETE